MSQQPNTKKARPMSSAAASPARTSASPGKAPDLPESVQDSGGNYYEPFAWFDPDTQSWRTWQRCLVEGWETFSETWPRSAMTRNFIAYRRAPLVPLTGGTGYGLLPSHSIPTPTASDHIERQSTSAEKVNPLTNKSVSLDRWVRFWPTPTTPSGGGERSADRAGTGNLHYMARKGLWPTPDTRGFTNKGSLQLLAKMAEDQQEMDRMAYRASKKTKNEGWPTPNASDHRDRGNLSNPSIQRRMAIGKQYNLSMVVSDQSGALNPTWVSWLMGYPLDWLDLPSRPNRTSRASKKASPTG